MGGDRRGWHTAPVRELLTYGPGIPRYLALWVPLAALLAVVLARARLGRAGTAVVVVSTLPTFVLHNPPHWPAGLRVLAVCACFAVCGAWFAESLRGDSTRRHRASAPAPRPAPARPPWTALAAAALLAVAVRAPLAWTDPGIGDFALASEVAAQELLAGRNPYISRNPHATVGTYQYPAGTILAHLPLVGADPGVIAGEQHLGARATVWAVDVLAILLLGWGLARLGRPLAGAVAGFVYAVHPTLVRESGIVVANDVLLGALVAGTALALAGRRPRLAGLLAGLAVAVKPAALVLVPFLAGAGGALPALIAVALPTGLQVPFLLWPSPGLYGLAAIVEPTARLEPQALDLSIWLPLYRLVPPQTGLLRLLAVIGVLASLALAWATGRAVRRAGWEPAAALAGAALPLLVAYTLGTRWPTNFQSWYLVPLVCGAALAATSAVTGRSVPPTARHPGATPVLAAPRPPSARSR